MNWIFAALISTVIGVAHYLDGIGDFTAVEVYFQGDTE